jgi:hypothetical protein
MLGFADVDAGSVRVADLEWNKARGQLRGLQVACSVERITCRSTQALSRNVAAFSSRRVSSRARLRSRMAASAAAGPYTGVRSPERMRRASCLASRRSVVTRSPALLGIREGATPQQTSP